MVKPGESSKLLEAAQKYFGIADSIWKEAQRALERAEEERNKALAILHEVERGLKVVELDDQEQDNHPPNVASKKGPPPPTSTTTTSNLAATTISKEELIVDEEPRVRNRLPLRTKRPRRQADDRTRRLHLSGTESEDDDEAEDGHTEPPSVGLASPTFRRINNNGRTSISSSNNDRNSSISSTVDWIPDFYRFLVSVPHGRNKRTVSAKNAIPTIRQVEKLATGEGITYQHWPHGTVFASRERIDCDTINIQKLFERAVQFEKDYGRDRSSSRLLLRHPIKKLQLYQDFVRNNPSSDEVMGLLQLKIRSPRKGKIDQEVQDPPLNVVAPTKRKSPTPTSAATTGNLAANAIGQDESVVGDPRVLKRQRRQPETNANDNTVVVDTESEDDEDEDHTESQPAAPVSPVIQRNNSNNHDNNNNRKSSMSSSSSSDNIGNNNTSSISSIIERIPWIPNFYHFLVDVPHGRNQKTVTAATARALIRQVEKLATGKGIAYRPWPSGKVFASGERIDYNHNNLQRLYERAEQFEKDYGKDKGNGWLLRQPITKLQLFRDYRQQFSQKLFYSTLISHLNNNNGAISR
jgi:hypothetical protein